MENFLAEYKRKEICFSMNLPTVSSISFPLGLQYMEGMFAAIIYTQFLYYFKILETILTYT